MRAAQNVHERELLISLNEILKLKLVTWKQIEINKLQKNNSNENNPDQIKNNNTFKTRTNHAKK